MKKIIFILTALVMTVILVACDRLEKKETAYASQAADDSQAKENVQAKTSDETSTKASTKGEDDDLTGEIVEARTEETRAKETRTEETQTEETRAKETQPKETTVEVKTSTEKGTTSDVTVESEKVVQTSEETKTEKSAAHEHSWKEVTETIYHEAETESRWVVDSEAWDETVEIQVPVYEERVVCVVTCRGCGMQFTGGTHGELVKACHMHIINEHDNMCGYGQEDSYWETVQTGTETKLETIHHEEEGHWEDVVVKQAWSETVVTGYVCTVCGQEK